MAKTKKQQYIKTRRHKKIKIGNSHPKSKSKTKKNKNKDTIIYLKNNTPLNNQLLAKEFIAPSSSNIFDNNIEINRSFSPEINNNLITMISDNISNAPIAECNNTSIMKQKQIATFKKHSDKSTKFLVNIGTTANPKCVDFDTVKAKEVLLEELAKSKHINSANIIAPKQLYGNCWFNTMFMTFCVSDKGRKFFRFFRQLMIEGKTTAGKKIKNKLHRALFLFNLSIEACYNLGNKAITRDLANMLDTNNIIVNIWQAMPIKYRNIGIVDVDDANNPLDFYESLIDYLGNSDISILKLNNNQLAHPYNFSQEIVRQYFLKKNVKADVFIIEISDGASHVMEKQTSYEITVDDELIKYALDSIIIRDINKEHFCSMITCNKREFGFDGASYSRLTSFKWKNKINKNLNWSFEYANNSPAFTWNFKSGYQILFYYRIK